MQCLQLTLLELALKTLYELFCLLRLSKMFPQELKFECLQGVSLKQLRKHLTELAVEVKATDHWGVHFLRINQIRLRVSPVALTDQVVSVLISSAERKVFQLGHFETEKDYLLDKLCIVVKECVVRNQRLNVEMV